MSVTLAEYGDYTTAWCPGCGNFPILTALKQALVTLELRPHQVLLVSGIGQAAKTPHYLRANVFNGLHGRVLPVATGAKLANPELVVIGVSGDGCNYGEGGNHFLAAVRRNVDVTLLVHDNRIYGLTKGQASPTSPEGLVTKAQPAGVAAAPFNPIAVAITMRAGFVARGFAGRREHLATLIAAAVRHRGFALVDILQPCVSFNHVNTYKWYQERCYELGEEHDPSDRAAALALAEEEEEGTEGEEREKRIPLGILYRNDRAAFEEHVTTLRGGPLVGREVDTARLQQIIDAY